MVGGRYTIEVQEAHVEWNSNRSLKRWNGLIFYCFRCCRKCILGPIHWNKALTRDLAETTIPFKCSTCLTVIRLGKLWFEWHNPKVKMHYEV